jgi:hypothetical protein
MKVTHKPVDCIMQVAIGAAPREAVDADRDEWALGLETLGIASAARRGGEPPLGVAQPRVRIDETIGDVPTRPCGRPAD